MSRFITLGFVAVLMLALSLDVDGLQRPQRMAMEAKVAEFNRAFEESDLENVINAIPPGVIKTIAQSAGLSEKTLEEMLLEQTRTVMETVEIESYSMEVDGVSIELTSTGRPYAMIPTTTVVVAEEVKMKNRSVTVALKDGDAWYLARIDDPNQLVILQQAYPDFAEIEFPSGSMSIVE